jgi:hypothetical protein
MAGISFWVNNVECAREQAQKSVPDISIESKGSIPALRRQLAKLGGCGLE